MSESKFQVGSFWKRRDCLKAEILANDVECLDGMSVAVKVYGPRKYVGFLYAHGKKYDQDTCAEDLIEPWVDKKTVTLKRWLLETHTGLYITSYAESVETFCGRIIREYDSIEVEI